MNGENLRTKAANAEVSSHTHLINTFISNQSLLARFSNFQRGSRTCLGHLERHFAHILIFPRWRLPHCSSPSSSRQSLNREGRWGTTDEFTTSFLHFYLLSIALLDLVNSRPVHSLMLSPQIFLCLPCLLSPFHCTL